MRESKKRDQKETDTSHQQRKKRTKGGCLQELAKGVGSPSIKRGTGERVLKGHRVQGGNRARVQRKKRRYHSQSHAEKGTKGRVDVKPSGRNTGKEGGEQGPKKMISGDERKTNIGRVYERLPVSKEK